MNIVSVEQSVVLDFADCCNICLTFDQPEPRTCLQQLTPSAVLLAVSYYSLRTVSYIPAADNHRAKGDDVDCKLHLD
jgi:hypothetical protein